MTINFGKRNPGGLTAASPGDTLYVPFSTYNDSGASIGIGGTLAVSDIEVFKNGVATPRATDSGYSLISDTGQYGDLLGLHRFSVQIFNTADDTGFYDVGSHYHVAVDSITVDGRVVRFFPAVFEIGTPRANVVSVNGDTGAAAHLAHLADEYDTGRLQAEATATLDTGAVNQAVWAADASRTLTGWTFDTGVQQAIARLDTGLSETIDRILADTDTGIQPLTAAQIADAVWDERDTGHLDTGTYGRLSPRLSNVPDTGAIAVAVWAKDVRTLTGWTFDTGVQQALDRYDTGVRSAITQLSGKVDTGVPLSVWESVTRTLTAAHDTGVLLAINQVDTGLSETIDRILFDTDTGIQPLTAAQVADAVWDELDTGHLDTGTFGRLSPRLAKAAADLDTGTQNANITAVNSVVVSGSGTGGDPWGP